MQRIAKLTSTLATLAALAGPTLVEAQATTAAEPFKVGTFEIRGLPTVGLVLRDELIVELDAANNSLQLNPAYPRIPMPADMLGLIGQYEYGLKFRLYEIVNDLVARNLLPENRRPAYIHDVDDIRILPPIMYPSKVLNTAVNFYSHVAEGGTPEQRAAAIEDRRTNRGVPYMFMKPTRGAIIGSGDPIVIPWGRDQADWEVEIGTVIGRTARYVSAADAQSYVFGYMVTVDISDRGGRPPGGFSSGSDWFVGKGHDTSAPQGPWIVPKEFYGDPMQRLRQTLSVGGQVLQNSGADDMIHSAWEVIEYASSISTLFPGDVINNGTSGGTSMSAGVGSTATGAVRQGDLYLQPGETIEASVEGIGTLRHPVVAGEQPPGPMGARLPPVSTYRGRGGRGGGGGN
jgi:2-keto-4-pentenoate hydratase/2-oxohepta-3-ene-1,7-dioic acid hydratase in catechol pathway